MTDLRVETKEKILNAALELFAEKGPEGTSIRDLAKAADVNLASVNYHFSTKMNLYREVLMRGHASVSNEAQGLYEQCKNTPELAVAMFDMFLKRHRELANSFKLMLSSEVSSDFQVDDNQGQYVGPPGGQALAAAIERDLDRKVSLKQMNWAIRTIFSHVVHMALMINGPCAQDPRMKDYWSIPEIRMGVRRLAKVVLKDL
jgi:AcrR family transcriptional regulator